MVKASYKNILSKWTIFTTLKLFSFLFIICSVHFKDSALSLVVSRLKYILVQNLSKCSYNGDIFSRRSWRFLTCQMKICSFNFLKKWGCFLPKKILFSWSFECFKWRKMKLAEEFKRLCAEGKASPPQYLLDQLEGKR